MRGELHLSGPGDFNPKAQKLSRNWSKPKLQKSLVNGKTEVPLNTQILRINAKARHW
ncbi:YpzG family protein [Ureibacillus massiliensis]|uniref:YpzG family protein n=1 Tax=Ureibacillus massiliensis TaxID=292806 RepID=UPI0009FF3973|nr:YpzG family protein [Ureibacillus massiliensis]